MKSVIVIALLIFFVGCQNFPEKQEYMLKLHEGENNLLWDEDGAIFNRSESLPHGSAHIIIEKHPFNSRVVTQYAGEEFVFKIVSDSESGMIAVKEDPVGISLLQISPSQFNMKYIVIGNNGFIKIEKYELINVIKH